ncbi:MAG TPA: hypothetical protein ENK31_05490, partial [Nannocystis exedens]|nr:hypothetical protein [Nannocystis exedens]
MDFIFRSCSSCLALSLALTTGLSGCGDDSDPSELTDSATDSSTSTGATSETSTGGETDTDTDT